MSLKGCIKKVIAARGTKPTTFSLSKEGFRKAGNYTITATLAGEAESGFTVKSKDLSLNLTTTTQEKAEKAAVDHWEAQALDPDDQAYMKGLIAQGRPDQEIVNRLEQNIIKERDEVNWPALKTAEEVVSENKVITTDQTASEAAGREVGNTLLEERTDSAEDTGKKSEGPTPVGRTEDSAKPRSVRTPSDKESLGEKPGTWVKAGDSRVTSGNWIIHKTTDKGIDPHPYILNRKKPFKAMGVRRTLAEAKASALAFYSHEEAIGPDLGASFFKKFFKSKPEAKAELLKENLDLFNEKVVPNSPMLAHFVKSARVEFGRDNDGYSAETDIVYISGKGISGQKQGPSLDLNKEADLEQQVQLVEHEITHAYTAPYIQKVLIERQGTKEELANMAYLDNAIMQLEKMYRKGLSGPMKNVSEHTTGRIEYILKQPSLIMAMSEFVAIMNAETDSANEIYTALTGSVPEKNLRARIAAVIASITEAFLALTSKQLASEIDADVLQQAILNTFVMGKTMREQRVDEFTAFREKVAVQIKGDMDKLVKQQSVERFEKYKREHPEEYAKNVASMKEMRESGILGIASPFIKSGLNKSSKPASTATNVASFDYLNYAVATMINSKMERKGKAILGNLHDILDAKFPVYTDIANKILGIYNGSPALQQLLHAITGENVNKVTKANVLAKFAEINSQRTSITNEQIGKLVALSFDLETSEKADLDVFTSQMPLHDFFVANEAGDLSTAEKIEAKAELLRKELSKINNRAVRDVDSLVDWNIGIRNKKTGELEQKVTGGEYNLSTKYPPGRQYPTKDFQVKLRQLLALESIVRYGAGKFESLLKNEDLFDVIKDNSMANALATMDNEGTENVRDSYVMDYYKEPVEIKAVLQKDFRMYEFGENTGWKILKPPTRTELGIVYKETIDSTDLAGAYTDMKLSSTDVDVDQALKNFPGVVATRNGHKLLLTKQQKIDMGLIQDYSQGLVHSTAHSAAMQESQIIRDELLKEETHMTIGKGKSINKLESIIESENVDNPWFIKLEDGTEYSKLPAAVRAKYMPVIDSHTGVSRASNVKGFDENVDLVRKDISHWLLGGSSKSLFENPQMRWAVRILKNLVSGAKIGMVVLNPIKIANDNLSNLTYLGVLGVNPLFIASNYKEISTDFAEYSDLQRQIFQAKLQLVARPESVKVKKHLKNLQKRLAKSSIGDIGQKGFVNSLGSDLVSRSADTLSGFQADMHRSLEYLLIQKDGKKNVLSHFIMQMQKIGYQAEDFFGYLGDIASRSKSTALLHQELDQVSARLREIKSEEDIVNYVAQFTTSPSAETVRFGSAMTDLTDVLAKETLYRHLTQNKGMSPSDARISVLDSFPDYKENMPIGVKALSDVGIIMFPSFWLRIQKIIYRMARDKPVGLATELMVQEMLGTNVNTIFEANIINKSQQFGGIFHTPFEASGVGSVVPTNLW